MTRYFKKLSPSIHMPSFKDFNNLEIFKILDDTIYATVAWIWSYLTWVKICKLSNLLNDDTKELKEYYNLLNWTLVNLELGAKSPKNN